MAIDVHTTDKIETAILIAEGLKQRYFDCDMAGNIVKIDGAYHVGVGAFAVETPTLSEDDLAVMTRCFRPTFHSKCHRNTIPLELELETKKFDEQLELRTKRLEMFKKLKDEVGAGFIGYDLAKAEDVSVVVLRTPSSLGEQGRTELCRKLQGIFPKAKAIVLDGRTELQMLTQGG